MAALVEHASTENDAANESTKPDPDHRKPCTLCSKPCNVRIRCQIDQTGQWHLVCPGKCWTAVSGGVVDGDGDPAHKYYRYGGVWKNKHDAVSGKKPKKKKKAVRNEAEEEPGSVQHVSESS